MNKLSQLLNKKTPINLSIGIIIMIILTIIMFAFEFNYYLMHASITGLLLALVATVKSWEYWTATLTYLFHKAHNHTNYW